MWDLITLLQHFRMGQTFKPVITPTLTSPAAFTVGILIRYRDSEATLPRVLQALKEQTLQPDQILGVDTGSVDKSSELMAAAGAQTIRWPHAYEHSRVLNFGLQQLRTDFVLVLSSHTVLESPDTLARMVQSMITDERAACVSLKWDNDPYYSDQIDWAELQQKGLRFGSIYSNSMGMIRRSLWVESPFDETLLTSEDYAWALHQIADGHTCHRLSLPFDYRRNGSQRHGEFAEITFHLAQEHRLRVAWLGVRAALSEVITTWFHRQEKPHAQATRQRLSAWWRSCLHLQSKYIVNCW